jgi:hypothetical protein
LDFRDETDPDMRRFKLLWVFSSLYEFIKRRGRRETPLALTIDEFSAMAYKVTDGTNPLAVMLDEFIQQYLRGQNIWLTVSHQSIDQIDEQLRNSLLSLGTYMFGRAATMPEARMLADVLFKRDPMRVKYWHRVWMSGGSLHGEPLAPFIVDHDPEFMNLEDQLEEAANRIHELRLFEFLCRPAIREGEVSDSVIPLTIANLDRDEETGGYQFPNYERVALLRRALESQTGIPAATILKDLDAALPSGRAERDHRHLREQPPAQRAEDMATSSHQGEHQRHQQRRRIS